MTAGIFRCDYPGCAEPVVWCLQTDDGWEEWACQLHVTRDSDGYPRLHWHYVSPAMARREGGGFVYDE